MDENIVATIETKDVLAAEQTLSQDIAAAADIRAIAVVDEDSYKLAGQIGVQIKQKQAEVTEFFKPLKQAAHEAHAKICEKEKQFLTPLKEAERLLKNAIGSYIAEQERVRRLIEEQARKAAEAEAQRLLDEAVALEGEGRNEEAEITAKEAEMVDHMARNYTAPEMTVKQTGVSTSVDWEIVSVDEDAVPIAVAGVMLRPVDTAAVMRLIRASKGTVRIAGVTFRQKDKIAFRK